MVTDATVKFWQAHRDALLAHVKERRGIKTKKEQDAWLLGWHCATFMFAEQIMAMTGGTLKFIGPEHTAALRDLLDEPKGRTEARDDG